MLAAGGTTINFLAPHKERIKPACPECNRRGEGRVFVIPAVFKPETRMVIFKYEPVPNYSLEREGITIKLAGIAAMVCSDCGEIYFQPGGAEKVVEAANSIFGLATIERQHKHQLTAQICRV